MVEDSYTDAGHSRFYLQRAFVFDLLLQFVKLRCGMPYICLSTFLAVSRPFMKEPGLGSYPTVSSDWCVWGWARCRALGKICRRTSAYCIITGELHMQMLTISHRFSKPMYTTVAANTHAFAEPENLRA